jgi:hypothetical protein
MLPFLDTPNCIMMRGKRRWFPWCQMPHTAGGGGVRDQHSGTISTSGACPSVSGSKFHHLLGLYHIIYPGSCFTNRRRASNVTKFPVRRRRCRGREVRARHFDAFFSMGCCTSHRLWSLERQAMRSCTLRRFWSRESRRRSWSSCYSFQEEARHLTLMATMRRGIRRHNDLGSSICLLVEWYGTHLRFSKRNLGVLNLDTKFQ